MGALDHPLSCRDLQPEAAEPPIRKIEVYLLTQAPLRSDPDAVADNEHSDHQLRINRRPPRVTVERRKLTAEIAENDKPIDRPQYMLVWDMGFQ
jgi:hypothetical protein